MRKKRLDGSADGRRRRGGVKRRQAPRVASAEQGGAKRVRADRSRDPVAVKRARAFEHAWRGLADQLSGQTPGGDPGVVAICGELMRTHGVCDDPPLTPEQIRFAMEVFDLFRCVRGLVRSNCMKSVTTLLDQHSRAAFETDSVINGIALHMIGIKYEAGRGL